MWETMSGTMFGTMSGTRAVALAVTLLASVVAPAAAQGRRGAPPPSGPRFGTTERGRVIERFTRLGPDTMDYQVTVDDPGWYTAPWTASIPMTKVKGPIYEYACHEGNYALPGILAGERKHERDVAQKH